MFRRTAFTGRAAVLALVVCALALTLAYPIQRYVQQQQQISDLEEQVAEGKQHVQALEQEKQRWRDPNYVRQQARERLHFVLPGETGYVVLGGDQESDGSERTGGADEVLRQPWYDKLWGSVQAAAEEPRRTGKKPAGHIGPGPAPKSGG
jgi:cell division protein FtsB